MKNILKSLIFKAISSGSTDKDIKPVILMYHSIGDNGAQFTVTPADFDQQMVFLISQGRECLKLSEFTERLKSGTLPMNAVAVTFDDGYLDNHDVALPILKKYSIPATIFVTTGSLGKSFAINARFASATDELLKLQIMDEATIKKVSNEGLIEIMPHGHSHKILRDMSREDATEDIRQSKQIIESLTGKPATCFAYPSGKYSNETVEIVASLGFQSAVTVKEGIVASSAFQSGGSSKGGAVDSQSDLLQLPRMTVASNTSLTEFKCKVAKPSAYLKLKRLARMLKN